MYLRIFTGVVAASLASCASPYSRSGITPLGGVEAQMITNDTARISARGNGFTDQSRIMDFVLLKSAETTLAGGFTHFLVVGTQDASRVGEVTTPGTLQTTVYGNTAFSTYNPGAVHRFAKPGQDILVRFCKGSCPGMLPAQEIVQNLGPKYLQN